jgi:hypothetical protein
MVANWLPSWGSIVISQAKLEIASRVPLTLTTFPETSLTPQMVG